MAVGFASVALERPWICAADGGAASVMAVESHTGVTVKIAAIYMCEDIYINKHE